MEKTVYLTTGYEVELADEDGLQHLFTAIFMEVLTKLSESGSLDISELYGVCICELHYVAGQLRNTAGSLNIKLLLDEFHVHWDMLAERLHS